jgi:hypothetical protein
MVLTGLTESGAEEWLCPMCQRRMLLRWRPHFETLVLEHGDSNAMHAGSKGGARLRTGQATPAPPVLSASEAQWLRSNGIDWDGLAS